MNKNLSGGNAPDPCVTCSIKHKRNRPALCECKHCFISFCFECMKDHNDELKESIGQLSHRYNELQQLKDTTTSLIKNETIKSKQQLSKWYEILIVQLKADKAKIDASIENTEQEAQKFVLEIESKMKMIKDDIQTFEKNNIFQSAHMKSTLDTLGELTQHLQTVSVKRECDLPVVKPKYEFRFDFSTKSTKSNMQHTTTSNEQQTQVQFTTKEQPDMSNEQLSKSSITDISTFTSEATNVTSHDENYFLNRERFEPASYDVICMASDGKNIFYSARDDQNQNIIAYLYLDKKDCNYRKTDLHRIWKQSRITDIIWWNTIKKFVCATEKRIHTVEFVVDTFRIINIDTDQWEQTRIGANTRYLWLHLSEKIHLYNTNFQLIQQINFKKSPSIKCPSFCLTDNVAAFAMIKHMGNNLDQLFIQFYDFDMKLIKDIPLELNVTNCMIRTDGNKRFFVAAGQQICHIVSLDGQKETVNLGKQASCLAVVNRRNIVLTKHRLDLELVHC